MNVPLISNIQRFSIHDGEGIRTNIFFKGCPLRCAWCHNPESLSFFPQILVHDERCIKCLQCIDACPNHAIKKKDTGMQINPFMCTNCYLCVDACPQNALEKVGQSYSIMELLAMIEKDNIFYETSGGGVTLSGGEVMSQDIDYIQTLCKECKKKGISVCIDTSGYSEFHKFEKIIPFIDSILYDIKAIDNQKHLQLTKVENHIILENLKKLLLMQIPISIRMPILPTINDFEEDIDQIIHFLQAYPPPKTIHLLPYHSFGTDKYKKIGMEFKQTFTSPTQEKLESIQRQLQKGGFMQTVIGG